MASNIVTTRVALGELDVNSQTSSITANNAHPTFTATPEKRIVSKISSPLNRRQISKAAAQPTANYNQSTLGGTECGVSNTNSATKRNGTKRSFEALEEDVVPHENHKKSCIFQLHVRPDSILAEDNSDVLVSDRGLQQQGRLLCQEGNKSPSSGSASPDLSFGCSSPSAPNESQDTVITEPDSPMIRGITPGELRQVRSHFSLHIFSSNKWQKAQVMKLRLRLAAYKVQSNQMDIPISQLRIKTSVTPSTKLPTLLRPSKTAQTPQRRTPLPSAIPDVNLQMPTSEEVHSRTNIPSSPPSYSSLENAIFPGKEALVTPLLPRQRRALLNPPNLGSPAWKDRELTSSAVKGKAADSLLSLMHQQG